MKKYISVLFLFSLCLFGTSFVSCSDDDSPVDFESYLLGTWHSFKGIVYYDGDKYAVDINKTGEFSSSYMEFTFKQGGTGIGRVWVQDDNGMTRWIEEGISYHISGNTVNIIDEGEPLQLTFDEKTNCLYYRMVTKYDFEDTTIYVYFKK